MALQIGVLVAFTQLIPEHHVQVLGVFKARVKVSAQRCLDAPRELSVLSGVDTPHGVCDLLNGHVPHWLPSAVHSDPVWMAGIIHLAPILQEELGRGVERRPSIWRSK